MARHRVLGWFLDCFCIALFVLAFFLLAEGVASTTVAFRVTDRARAIAERLYCEYDPDLGWISKAKARVEGVFGPGKSVITNAERFRDLSETDPRVPAGRMRIICSGDSFTFGYGVDNEHSWCHQLSVLNSRIETVNMGQGGYGFDQAYLWYKRDGALLEQDLQIMAFISVDFDRMRGATANGYGKPVLVLESGRLVTKNTPVPLHEPATWPDWVARVAAVVENLKLTALLREWHPVRKPVVLEGLDREKIPDVTVAIIGDLARMHRRRGSILVLAYLPTKEDYGGKTGKYLWWRTTIAAAAQLHGAIFLDLVAEMSKLPPERIPGLFLSGEGLRYRGADGHYSEQGNRYIAETIYALLEREPRFQALFERRLIASIRSAPGVVRSPGQNDRGSQRP